MGNGTSADAAANATLGRLQGIAQRLETQEQSLRSRATTEKMLALRLRESDRTKARQALQRSKTLDANADRVATTATLVQNQMLALQHLQLNSEVAAVLMESQRTMKRLCESKNIQNVDQIMGEIDSTLQMSEDLSTALQQPLGSTPGLVANEDLDAELDALATTLQCPAEPVVATTTTTTAAAAVTPTPARVVTTASPVPSSRVPAVVMRTT